MAWFGMPPLAQLAEDGVSPRGPAIELFTQIAARMGDSVEWVGPIPLSRIDFNRQTGDSSLDGAILHAKTAELAASFLFPEKPFFVGIPSLAVRKTNPITAIAGIDDIVGYRIGFVRSRAGMYPAFIRANTDKIVLDELVGDDWTARNLAKLMANRLDAVFECNQYAIAFQAARAGFLEQIKILPLPGDGNAHYFAFFRNSAKAERLVKKYDSAAASLGTDFDAMVRAELLAPSGRTEQTKTRAEAPR